MSISHFKITETVDSIFGTTVGDLAITLSTGATITVESPNIFYRYQFGDEDAIDYGALKEKLLGDSNANLANANTGELTTDHMVGSNVTFSDFTYSEDAASSTLSFVASGVADIVTLGSNSQSAPNAGGGNDYYVVTRHQYGDVTINDSRVSRDGGHNIIKFDFGVSISHFKITETVDSIFGTTVGDLAITLSTGATITVESPNIFYRYQFGDEDAIDYAH